MGQATQRDHLLNGRGERQRRQLRHDGKASRDAETIENRERGAGDLDGSGGRLHEAGDGAEERGLAGAVRPDERDPLARGDVQVGVDQGGPAAIGDGQALGANGGGHSS